MSTYIVSNNEYINSALVYERSTRVSLSLLLLFFHTDVVRRILSKGPFLLNNNEACILGQDPKLI